MANQYGTVTEMMDCDPTHPLNQIKDWKPWEPKRKKQRAQPDLDVEFRCKTNLQKIRLLWWRQNELSRL